MKVGAGDGDGVGVVKEGELDVAPIPPKALNFGPVSPSMIGSSFFRFLSPPENGSKENLGGSVGGV